MHTSPRRRAPSLRKQNRRSPTVAPFRARNVTSRHECHSRAVSSETRAVPARHSELRVPLCLMGGRADEDENGNPPSEVPRALARYREARLRRAAGSRRLRVVSERRSTVPRVTSDVYADDRDDSARGTGWTSSAFANMRIAGRLDEDASDGSSSEEDDDAYAVFGRATIKAQSEALRDVGGVGGHQRPVARTDEHPHERIDDRENRPKTTPREPRRKRSVGHHLE